MGLDISQTESEISLISEIIDLILATIFEIFSLVTQVACLFLVFFFVC